MRRLGPTLLVTALLAGGLTAFAPPAVAEFTTGRLAGVVLDDAGHAVRHVPVVFRNSRGLIVEQTTTGVNGSWQSRPLSTSRVFYLCVDATRLKTTALAPYGYQSQCWDHLAPPPNFSQYWTRRLTPLSTVAGTTTGGIDFSLTRQSAVAGSIHFGDGTSAVSGNALATLFDAASGRPVRTTRVNEHGKYNTGVVPAGRYVVCWSALTAQLYTPRCDGRRAWLPYTASAYGPAEQSSPPPGVAAVTVRPGRITTLSPTLPIGSGITGTVTSARRGTALAGVTVDVYGTDGTQEWSGRTGLDGRYRTGPLAVSRSGYRVCVDASTADQPGRFGQQNACFGRGYWNGVDAPQHGSRVPVTAHTTVPGIDLALEDGGVISGTLTSHSYGMTVRVFQKDGTLAAQQTFDPMSVSQTYEVRGLPRNLTGYVVCAGGPNRGSVAPECYGAHWDGGALPPDATAVVVHRRGVTTHIDISLHRPAGSMYGLLTAGGGISQGTAYVYDFTGARVAVAPGLWAHNSGSWGVQGLLPFTDYHVCFVPAYRALAPRCYGDVAWDGPASPVPPDAAPIRTNGLRKPVDDVDVAFLPAAP